MKEKLLQAFDYPNDYVKTGIGLKSCAHGGHYDKNDKACALCDSVEECLWLQKNDECVDRESKSQDDLFKSLQFPLDYIDMQLAKAGHNIGLCSCDACSWLRETEALLHTYHKA